MNTDNIVLLFGAIASFLLSLILFARVKKTFDDCRDIGALFIALGGSAWMAMAGYMIALWWTS